MAEDNTAVPDFGGKNKKVVTSFSLSPESVDIIEKISELQGGMSRSMVVDTLLSFYGARAIRELERKS